MAKTRRSYKGGAASTTISSSIAASGTTSFIIAAYTGWPYGSAPFFVAVEPGTSNEEKMLVTRTGATDTTLNVYSSPSVAANRGMDGTTAFAHATGSTIYPVFTAADADEANEVASTLTSQGDILYHGAATFARLGIGGVSTVLRVNSGASAPEWGQVATAGIADSNVTTAKIADSNITLAKLASAVQNLLVPAGTIMATVRSTADAGYLLLNGTPVTTANVLYPSLWAVAPASWKSGTTLNLPNTTDQLLGGAGTTTLGALGGSNTITEANLPAHAHTMSAHTHTMPHTHSIDPINTSVSISDPGHVHNISEPNSGQGHFHNGISGSQFTVQYIGTAGGSVDTSAGPHTAFNHPNTAYSTTGITVNSHPTGITAAVDIAAFNSGPVSTGSTAGPSTDSTGNGSGTGATFRAAQLAVTFQIKAH